jgi:hypothetical protein
MGVHTARQIYNASEGDRTSYRQPYPVMLLQILELLLTCNEKPIKVLK